MNLELDTKMEQAVWAARSLFERGKAAGSTANISFRHEDWIYISASGSCFGTINKTEFSVVDRDGNHVGGPKPSKELPLHKTIYDHKRDVGAVIHTHSFYAVLWSCLNHPNTKDVIPTYTPYLKMKTGRIGMVPYAPPGSLKLFRLFEEAVEKSDGYLLANHGSVVGGRDIKAAFCELEELEESARVAWYLREAEANLLEEQVFASGLKEPVSYTRQAEGSTEI